MWLPSVPRWSRSQNWAEVGEIARRAGKTALLIEDSSSALDAALAGDWDLILICGSLYLAADLRGRFPLPEMLMKGEDHESADR